MNDIKKQIDEMTNLITANTAAPSTESTSTDAPNTSASATDPPSTEAPNTKAAATDPPGTDAPKTEAPTTDVPNELDGLRNTIEELNKKIDDLKAPKTTVPKTSVPTTDVPIVEEDFVGDTDLDDILRDKDKFNKLLNTVHQKGVEAGRAGQEKVLRSLPDIVKTNISITEELKVASDKFYNDNKDLVPFKKVVGHVFEEVASKDPSKTYGDILKDVGPEVRRRLDLQQQTINKEDDKDKDKMKGPKLPKRSVQSRQSIQKPKTDDLMDELDAMNKSLEDQ